MSEKQLYIYEGPVMQFNKVIQKCYRNGTQANSEARALSNLQFSYKRKNKLETNAKIMLDGKYLRIEKGYVCKN